MRGLKNLDNCRKMLERIYPTSILMFAIILLMYIPVVGQDYQACKDKYYNCVQDATAKANKQKELKKCWNDFIRCKPTNSLLTISLDKEWEEYKNKSGRLNENYFCRAPQFGYEDCVKQANEWLDAAMSRIERDYADCPYIPPPFTPSCWEDKIEEINEVNLTHQDWIDLCEVYR